MKKAFITDWLDKYGGAERVITALHEIYDFDYNYCYIDVMKDQDKLRTFAGKTVDIVQSRYLCKAKKYFRWGFLGFPFIVKEFNKQTRNNKVDVVISSSWALSKAYRIGTETHICYLQARNMKYVWEEADQYFTGMLTVFKPFKPFLQRFDLKSAKNPDYLIANSVFVKNWVKRVYNRDAVVIYPPVDVEDFYITREKGEEYYITVGRLEPYKRFDIIVEAFKVNGKKLIVVGDGSVLKKLKKSSEQHPNIVYTGYKLKSQIAELISKSKGFVFAGVEDFGIALIEALASGVPVIAYKGGATPEIIEEGVNGLTYDFQTPESLNNAITNFENGAKFIPEDIRASGMRYSKVNFQEKIFEFINKIIATDVVKGNLPASSREIRGL